MRANAEHVKRVIVIGAGEAGLSAAVTLGSLSKRRRDVRVTLIDERGAHSIPYVCREYLTGRRHSSLGVDIPLQSFFEGSRVAILEEKVINVETSERFVQTDKGRYPYDYLLLAPDALPDFESIPGAKQHAFTFNGLSDVEVLRRHVMECFEQASKESDSSLRKALLTFAVIGGAPDGVQLAISLSEWFAELRLKYWVPVEEIEVVLVERNIDVVPGYLKRVRDVVERSLMGHNIRFLCGTPVSGITETSLTLEGGIVIPSKTAILAERTKAPEFIQALGNVSAGRVSLDADLRTPFSGVYLAGETTSPYDPRREGPIPAGHKDAGREGMVAACNIWGDIVGGTSKSCLSRYIETHSMYLGEEHQLVYIGRSILPHPLAKIADRVVRMLSIYRLGGLTLFARFPGLVNTDSPGKTARGLAA